MQQCNDKNQNSIRKIPSSLTSNARIYSYILCSSELPILVLEGFFVFVQLKLIHSLYGCSDDLKKKMLGFFQFFRKLQEDDYRKTTSVQEYLMKGKKTKP